VEDRPGLVRLVEPDEVYERRVTELHEIEREAAGGRIDADALERRRAEVLQSITHHVMGGHLSSYSSAFDGLDQTELFPRVCTCLWEHLRRGYRRPAVSTQDFDAEQTSICQGELDLEVPALQVTEVAL
jgi:hypothetical protein